MSDTVRRERLRQMASPARSNTNPLQRALHDSSSSTAAGSFDPSESSPMSSPVVSSTWASTVMSATQPPLLPALSSELMPSPPLVSSLLALAAASVLWEH